MCVYVGSEIVLANLLQNGKRNEGVSPDDITNFCDSFKKAVVGKKGLESKYVYFDVNSRALDEVVGRYKKEFRRFQNKFYMNRDINIKHFNARFDPDIVSIFKEVADSLESYSGVK